MRRRCNKLQFKAWLEKREIVKYNSEIESRAFTRGPRLRFRKAAYYAPKIVYAILGNRANGERNSYDQAGILHFRRHPPPFFFFRNFNIAVPS